MIAEGTKLFFNWAFLQFITLYLWPDGSNLKNWPREWSGTLTIARARRAIASSFASDRQGEGDYLGCYVWGFEESVFAGDREQGEAAGGTVH